VSLTTEQAIEVVSKAKRDHAIAGEKLVATSQAKSDAEVEYRSATLNYQEAQRVLLEIIDEEDVSPPTNEEWYKQFTSS
jgi:hypothetical protein